MNNHDTTTTETIELETVEVDDTPDKATAIAISDVFSDMAIASRLKLYTYSFKQGDRVVHDLSIDGVNKIATACGVSIESVEIVDETDEHITVSATAIDRNGTTDVAIVREPKLNRYGKPNPYALNAASAKAKRNARKSLIPLAEARAIITGHGKDVADDNADIQ